jgi:serine protease Do
MLHQVTPAVVDLAIWKERPPTTPGGERKRVRTHGSGFIVDETGLIVTNRHVVDDAVEITVVFDGGERATAKLIAVAPMVDLAVLKVDVDRRLASLRWGNSLGLRLGDHVFAIGNPLGLGMSVSSGIVSALNRDIQDTPFDHYIQIDAAINHGNSGGPLVDVNGEVVGVDTALYNPDEKGGFIGIGFAIPAESAKYVVRRLVDHLQPGWLGVRLQDISYELALALGVNGTKGAIITAVDEHGPARAAGLRPSDILLAINDLRFGDARAIMREIVQTPIGQTEKLTVWRGGKEQMVTTTVAEWPSPTVHPSSPNTRTVAHVTEDKPDAGVKLAPLTREARRTYAIDPGVNGALVTFVDKDSEARDLGIVPGDVLSFVQDTPVVNPKDVQSALQAAYEKRLPFLAVLVQGKTAPRWVSFSLDASSR